MLDNFYALRFLYLLTQAWTDTEAYKLGLIDANGNILVKHKDLTTEDQKAAFTKFHLLVWNIKKLLEKVPLGKTTIARYATALYLIKEETGLDLQDHFVKYLKENNIEFPKVTQIFIESKSNKYVNILGLSFIMENNELSLVENETGGIEFVDKKLEAPEDFFAGNIVFTCDQDTYMKCRLGKAKFARYKTYVGDDDVGQKIRNFGNKHPKKNIILKDSRSGAMLYLRKH